MLASLDCFATMRPAAYAEVSLLELQLAVAADIEPEAMPSGCMGVVAKHWVEAYEAAYLPEVQLAAADVVVELKHCSAEPAGLGLC